MAITFHGYNLLSYPEVLEECPSVSYETFYSEALQKEVGYYCYVPDNCSQDASFYTYYTADRTANEYSGKPIINYIYDSLEDDSSQVVTIIPDLCANSYKSEDFAKLTAEMIEREAQKNDLNINNITIAGFSKTGDEAVYSQAYLNKYFDIQEDNILVVMDGTLGYPGKVSEEYREYLENTTVFICGTCDGSIEDWCPLFKNAILFDNPDFYQTDNGKYHPFRNLVPALDGISDFALGYKDLKNIEKYSFKIWQDGKWVDQIYNPNTGEYEKITYEYVKKLTPEIFLTLEEKRQKRLDYLTGLENYTLKYDRPAIEDYIKNIMKQISNVANKLSITIPTYTSTTKVPNIENEYITTMNDDTIEEMYELSRIIEYLVKIGESIEEVETTESEEASNLETSGVTPSQEETKPEITTDNPSPSPSRPVSPETNNGTSEGEIQTPPVEEPTITPQPEENQNYDMEKDFPTYESLNSTNNKTVIDKGEYKEVIHYNGEEIIGIEHYYDFKTEEEATAKYEDIINKYISDDAAKKVIQNERYIKVTFDKGEYNN